MNQINVHSNQAFYHTKKDLFQSTEEGINTFNSTITGWYKGDLHVGDKIIFGIEGDHHTITEVIERRNHAGNFQDPEDKKNSFFKVNTTFQRTVEPPKDK